jgi:PilZ domain-containing protein/flagellar protein YcgR
MTDFKKLVDKRWIAIGKSLPFSIYDSQRKLLLAQGHVVESARSLERLLEQGEYYKPEHPDAQDRTVVEEALEADPVDPLTALNRDYSNIAQRARCGVKIAPRETGESYLCWVIGVSQENRGLVMTAPSRADKGLAAISKGQVWFCRMFSSTSVFRFRGAILKVAFDPYPYLHILVPEVIEKRLIRQLPRALVSLQATLMTPASSFASVVDLSVGGARVAVDRKLVLDVGHPLELVVTLEVLGRTEELRLQAKVAVVYGVVDTRHPGIAFYGLAFDGLDERLTFMLHGYVQQQLASEYDALGQVLARGTGVSR